MKDKPISTDDVSAGFKRLGIEFSNERFSFLSDNSKKEVQIYLREILTIELRNSSTRILYKALFWIQRFLFWDKHTESSSFDNQFEYRYNYDLIFHLTTGRSRKKIIKHFDLFSVKKIIHELNAQIKLIDNE